MKTEKLEFYVNYNMSKILNKIIGEKNFFFITQNGFITTAELINNITTANDYIKVDKASYKDMNVIAAHKYFIPE
jgi:hypothetical protein